MTTRTELITLASLMRRLPAKVRGELGLDREAKITRCAGLSNAMARIETARGTFAVRLSAKGDGDRRLEVLAGQQAAALGIGPAVIHADPATGLLVTEWVAGSVLDAAGLGNATVCAQAGAALRRFHRSGLELGPALNLTAVWSRYEARAAVLGHGPAPSILLGKALVEALADRALPVPSHGDPGPGNWIASSTGLRLIDWEFAAAHPPAWDLASLAFEAGLAPAARDALWSGYGGLAGGLKAIQREELLVAWTGVLWALARPLNSFPMPRDWIARRIARTEALARSLGG